MRNVLLWQQDMLVHSLQAATAKSYTFNGKGLSLNVILPGHVNVCRWSSVMLGLLYRLTCRMTTTC